MKKVVSILICAVLIFGVFSVPASAVRTTSQKNCEDAIVNAVYNMKSELDVSKYQIDRYQIDDIFSKIYYHYPELNFYFDFNNTRYTYSNYTYIVSKISFVYTMDRSTVNEKRKIINDAAAAVLYGIDDNWSDTLKALYIHDMLCVNYQYDNTLFTDEGNENHHMLEMIEDGAGVCQAYTEMYLYLLRLCGIDSYMMMSIEDNHSWNVVKIDNRWYHVDVTHDDPIVDRYASLDYIGRASHEFFLLSDTEIDNGSHDNGYIPFEIDETVTCYKYTGNDSFREAVSAVIPMDDGYWYYMDYDRNNGGLVKTKDFYNTQLVYGLDGFWEMNDSYGYYYYYTGLYEYNGNLFFIDYDTLYVYDLEDNKVEGVMELTEEGKKNGRFYGFYLYDGVCLFMVAKDANGLDMSVLTVGVCEYGHTIEKWETVTEATMFQQGYKIKYCDICFDITDEEIIDKLPIPDGAGDCDDDGLIRSGDLAVLKLYLADNYMGTMGSGADFNKDNRIDAIDLSLLKLFLASAQ